MSKFYGKIGYEELSETSPSVYTPTIVERCFSGQTERDYTRVSPQSNGVNDDISLSNEISFVADPYALNHFHTIRYVVWHGARWRVTGAEEKFPRINLTIGGVYNGPEPEEDETATP